MKVTAHLDGGGMVELDFTQDIDFLDYRGGQDPWIKDRHGALINVDHVVAWVPAVETPPLPRRIVDRGGDEWILDSDSMYRMDGDSYPRTRKYIEENYGIREEVS